MAQPASDEGEFHVEQTDPMRLNAEIEKRLAKAPKSSKASGLAAKYKSLQIAIHNATMTAMQLKNEHDGIDWLDEANSFSDQSNIEAAVAMSKSDLQKLIGALP